VSYFQPHLEVLPPPQMAIWPLLAPSVGLGLVLYGGTAVALRLGHRTSIDFDFFTERSLDRDKLGRDFVFMKNATVIQSQPDTLSVIAPVDQAAVKLSFFGSIGIERVGIPQQSPDGAIEVASLLDLLATKLKVFLQRIEAKDYMDIAAILRSGVRLEDGLAAASALYSTSFQPSEALKALTYFHGGDLDRLSAVDRATLVRSGSATREIPLLGLASRSLSSRL
jgi:hypothetical protein